MKLMSRLQLREILQKNGEKFIEQLSDDDLKYFAGEVLSLNEDFVWCSWFRSWGDITIKVEEIMKNGFSELQMRLIKRLDEKIKKLKQVR